MLVFSLNTGITLGQENHTIVSATPAESSDESVSSPKTTDLTVKIVVDYNGTEQHALKDAEITVHSTKKSVGPKTTDDSGEVIFKSLHRSAVSLTVKAEGLTPSTFAVVLEEKEQTEHITIPWPMGQLKITVFGSDGLTPVPACRVKLVPSCGIEYPERQTNLNGVVTAKDLPFGEMTITAIATGWETLNKSFNLKREEDTMAVSLTKQSPPQGSN
jgi:hypothetical protein